MKEHTTCEGLRTAPVVQQAVNNYYLLLSLFYGQCLSQRYFLFTNQLLEKRRRNYLPPTLTTRLLRWLSGEEPAYQCRTHKRHGFDPWIGKIPWRKAWQPTPVFWPGESHGQRSLVGYSPQGHAESDVTESDLAHTHAHNPTTNPAPTMTIFNGRISGRARKDYQKQRDCLIASNYLLWSPPGQLIRLREGQGLPQGKRPGCQHLSDWVLSQLGVL